MEWAILLALCAATGAFSSGTDSDSKPLSCCRSFPPAGCQALSPGVYNTDHVDRPARMVVDEMEALGYHMPTLLQSATGKRWTLDGRRSAIHFHILRGEQ